MIEDIFTKKGIEFRVVAEGTDCKIYTKDIEAKARPSYYKRIWHYIVKDKRIIKLLVNKEIDSVMLKSKKAEELFEAIKKAKIEKERKEILNSKIELGYYYGNYYRVNSLFVGDEVLDFGNVGNIFSNEKLKKHFGKFPSERKITEKLGDYFKKYKLIFSKENKSDELENQKGITVEYNDDPRGKYVSNIIFDDFKTFEKYVLKAFENSIKEKEQKEKQNQEHYNKCLQIAKEKNEKIKLRRYTTTCNDPRLECNTDIITEYITPENKIVITRTHTY